MAIASKNWRRFDPVKIDEYFCIKMKQDDAEFNNLVQTRLFDLGYSFQFGAYKSNTPRPINYKYLNIFPLFGEIVTSNGNSGNTVITFVDLYTKRIPKYEE
jgi:hypothetical protein